MQVSACRVVGGRGELGGGYGKIVRGSVIGRGQSRRGGGGVNTRCLAGPVNYTIGLPL